MGQDKSKPALQNIATGPLQPLKKEYGVYFLIQKLAPLAAKAFVFKFLEWDLNDNAPLQLGEVATE